MSKRARSTRSHVASHARGIARSPVLAKRRNSRTRSRGRLSTVSATWPGGRRRRGPARRRRAGSSPPGRRRRPLPPGTRRAPPRRGRRRGDSAAAPPTGSSRRARGRRSAGAGARRRGQRCARAGPGAEADAARRSRPPTATHVAHAGPPSLERVAEVARVEPAGTGGPPRKRRARPRGPISAREHAEPAGESERERQEAGEAPRLRQRDDIGEGREDARDEADREHRAASRRRRMPPTGDVPRGRPGKEKQRGDRDRAGPPEELRRDGEAVGRPASCPRVVLEPARLLARHRG